MKPHRGDLTTKKEATLSQAILKEWLAYDPISGHFVRLKPTSQVCVGEQVGYVSDRGYRYILLLGYKWRASRLAFLYMTGHWPRGDADHRDGNTNNDAWENLRDSEVFQNLGNMRRPRHNKSGIKGVYWNKEKRKWSAQIQIDGRSTHIGHFDRIEDAAEAYRMAAEKRFGEFARPDRVAA